MSRNVREGKYMAHVRGRHYRIPEDFRLIAVRFPQTMPSSLLGRWWPNSAKECNATE